MAIDRFDWEFLDKTYGDCGLHHFDIEFGDVIDRCRGVMCYLATPYSEAYVNVGGKWCDMQSEMAVSEASKWLTYLAASAITAVSPIAVSAQIGADVLGPSDQIFWAKWCAPILRASHCVIVPKIQGWDQSLGVWEAVCKALNASKPVYVLKEAAEYG